MPGVDHARLERAVAELIRAIGEDAGREGLVRTPARVAESWAGFAAGVGRDAADDFGDAMPAADATDTVVVRDLAFRSMCEHHLLPFSGTAQVAYRPAEHVAGLGRFAAALETVSSRPQVQERIGEQLADAVDRALAPLGVLVVLEASHTCVTARDPRQAASTVVTLSARGDYRDPVMRAEALALLGAERSAR